MKDKNMELYCCSFNFIEDLEESDPKRLRLIDVVVRNSGLTRVIYRRYDRVVMIEALRGF